MGEIIMSTKEQNLYHQAMSVIDKRLTISEFSILINKSYRQSRRIIKNISEKGIRGIKHGNIKKKPINKTTQILADEVLSLLKSKYSNFNLTHFREMLKSEEGILIGKNVIHRIAKSNHLVKRPKRRARKIYKPRPRMPQEGMLLQMDGSCHKWFGNFESDLIGAIDDATSEVVGAEFFIGETSLHCMKVMKDIVLSKGIPGSFYLDQAGFFGKQDRDQSSTQIGRALEELGCEVILAGSPQAKGRIERLWNTFQDRLIAELRFYQIANIPAANKFLWEYFIPKYNKMFTVKPRVNYVAYRKLSPELDLEFIFCTKEYRKIGSGGIFSWKNERYQIESSQDYRYRTIHVNLHYPNGCTFTITGKKVNVKKVEINEKRF